MERDQVNTSHYWDDFDTATCLWIEHIFADGLPKGYGSDALAALQHFLPEVSGKLRNSWRLLKTWNRMEPPLRVLPISPLLVGAMGGLLVSIGWCRPAALLLAGFDAFLRPGEMYHFQVQDVIWASGRATLVLHNTKSGQSKGADEMVFVQSLIATRALRVVCQQLPRSSYILDRSPAACFSICWTISKSLETCRYTV